MTEARLHPPIVRAHGLWKKFGPLTVLKGVDLEVPVFRVSPRTAPERRSGNIRVRSSVN